VGNFEPLPQNFHVMKTIFMLAAAMILWGDFKCFPQYGIQGNRNDPHVHTVNLNWYTDLAKNNTCSGFRGRMAVVTTLGIKDYQLKTGFLWTWPRQIEVNYSGWFVHAGGYFRIRKPTFEVTILYLVNLVSANVRETNLGVTLGYTGRHFSITLGNNSRTYLFLKKGYREKGLNEAAGNAIIEPRNFMYSFAWNLKPKNHPWNTMLRLTNFDHFLIQQETNPMLALLLPVQFGKNLTLCPEFWYQPAGLLNLQVNYFGYYVRLGVTWKLR
jgi:hypothetical protein